MKFTFNEEKHELTVEDDGRVKRFILYDNMWEVTYLILKAIDLLDNEGGGGSIEVAEWAKTNSSEKIPVEKLNTGIEPGQIPVLDENGQLPAGSVTFDTLLEDGDRVHIDGGTF